MRDRSAWVLGFLAPVAVATLISFAFSGAESFHTDVAVVDEDHGVLAAAFTGFLASPELGVALVIPAGFSDAAHGGTVRPITVLTTVDSPLAGEVARSIAGSFVAQLNADRLAVATAVAAGAPPADLAAQAASLRLPEQVVRQASGARLKSVSYYGPAMGIFFMFFAIGFGARSYFLERRGGVHGSNSSTTEESGTRDWIRPPSGNAPPQVSQVRTPRRVRGIPAPSCALPAMGVPSCQVRSRFHVCETRLDALAGVWDYKTLEVSCS